MAGDDAPTPDFSRRDALKKIGIGAGIAWSAPVVLSFYNAAGAATGTPDTPTTPFTGTVPMHPECVGSTCDNVVRCSSSNPDCGCVQTGDPAFTLCVPGSTPCHLGPACAPDFSCPPGYFCAVDTCCHTPVCAPLSIAANCPPGEPTDQGQATPRLQRVPTGTTFFN